MATPDSPHLVVVPHTHWDREWYRPFQEFRARLVQLIDRLLDLLETDASFSHFHFDGQTIVLEDYLEIRPDNRQRLRRLIRDGRIAVGPWYVLPDEFLVSGESLVRNLQIGHRVAAVFGQPQKIGYLPDQFGHIAQMPQILCGFGIDDAVVWRGVGPGIDRSEFLWEAPDGSRVFTVYLPGHGYSNGQRLPADAERLRWRLQRIVDEHRPFRRIDTVLVMCGTDHQEPTPGLPAALAAAAVAGGFTAEIAPLRRYIERARAQTLGDDCEPLPVHRGELRSCARMHLLPGVTSVRVRQKQRDFFNVSRLERYAEPLATWADWLSGKHQWSPFTDWAWKLALHNHPHDSICGCSVDQVHRDMEYRFDQVEAVAEQTFHAALNAVTSQLDTRSLRGDRGLAVYNPGHASRAVVCAEVTHDAPEDLVLVDQRGEPLAIHVEPGTRRTLLDAELPPAEVRSHVEAMSGREILGVFINEVAFDRDGERLGVHLVVDRVARGELDVEAVRQRWLAELDDPALRSVQIVARTAAVSRLTFCAELDGFGFTTFAFARRRALPPAAMAAGEDSLENRFYRIDVEDDGTLRIFDKELGVELPRCNWFVDEGDRGDEYNFDALLDPQRVTSPSRCTTETVGGNSPVLGRLRLCCEYDLPRRLESDRETRSAERVTIPIETTVTLYAEVKRIDFLTTIDNRAEDHRLRVWFQTPVRTDSAFFEQAFAVVERTLEPEAHGRLEDAIGTVPQKTFCCVEDGRLGVALFNRGIPEVEAVRGSGGVDLVLTLLRSVGWLSRGDLRMRRGHAGPGLEAPGAQSLGTHRFEYALTTYRDSWVEAQIVRQAHEFAYPPAAVPIQRRGVGDVEPRLLRCDNPHVIVSAVAPGPRADRFFIRCYNSTPRPQVVNLRPPHGLRMGVVDFLGRPERKYLRRTRGQWLLELKPFEIANLLLFGQSRPGGDVVDRAPPER